jgi:probable O-glycosylation ligase (exosortase A-associated)
VGKLILAVIILASALATLTRPWVGVTAYYLLAILGPQYIWWWNFQGLRVSLIIALSTITGVILQILRSDYDSNFIFNKQSMWLFFLWLSITNSYFFGPYVSRFSSAGLSPGEIFAITNTIFLFYFFAALVINDISKLRYLVIVFVGTTVYLCFWANNQYFSQNWSQFNMGRLMGPASLDGSSIYRDENTFAMLFVCGIPFIYYFGWEINKKWMRWGLWISIPLAWHAIFLTGSRGGLVGLGATMFAILLQSRRKIFIWPLLLFFWLFYLWQAGNIMHERSGNIINIEGESSASNRITAWEGGLRMILTHPISGVGLGSFITALPEFIESRHMVAHNTFIQFAAESGIVAGFAYVAVVFLFFKQSIRIRRWLRSIESDKQSYQIELYNNASTTSFVGLSLCGLFLSLNIYEIVFVLLLFNSALYQICLKKVSL